MVSLPQINTAINRLIYLLDTCTSPIHIQQIQAQLIRQSLYEDTTIAYSFITACQFTGLLDSAHLLYSQIQRPDVFICNTLIKAFSHTQSPLKSISFYTYMNKNSVFPNHYTFPFVLKALSDLRDLKQGQCVHTQIVKLGQLNDIYVQNSLLNLYASGRQMDLCRKVFDEMPHRDVVSWTVMITGFREAGKFDDALTAFEQMQFAGVSPNEVTMVNALTACSNTGALDVGIRIHDFIRRSGWPLDVILGTSLIHMYGKCGGIEEGLGVFQSMEEKNVFTWNALIKGLALAKSGEEAVWWFFRMEQEGIKPDEVTLLGALCACSHSGLIQMAEPIFRLLIDGKYGFEPGIKHYACMVDLFARSGHVEEALKIMKEMPFEPTKPIWSAFLAGCRAHGDLEMSEYAAWKLIELHPENSSYYVLLSNIYAQMGRRIDAEKVLELMKERRLKRDLGCSSVELQPQDHVHELLA
ncbi:pentatricopeptide repeat-containing protein At5g06540-like [Actinidia eriantha]|uniref:pentatricopeptide repeat-containing protein At5g06540-like n=1 Tax=Actinidia eriantha TaxID=165200 RepID=UPI00258E3F5E|nr:pentatricopeptide repeat-containing protein At5g06540-like [Actinidia eriantha]